MKSEIEDTEIIVGVGNWEMLQAAAKAKADAIYFGVKGLNMRDFAKNFEISELEKVVGFCHENKIKAYLALNVLVYESELEKVERIIKQAKKAKVDAIIAFDLSVMHLAKKHNLELHVSTQMSISNSIALKYFEDLGAKRVVVARECSFADLKELNKKSNLDIELFVHGSMCFSLSGRCYLSLFMHDDKSANRGLCTQPCRRKWKVEGSDVPVEIYENTIMSSKDLKSIDFIDKLLDEGFKHFKIEGRTKTADYVYIVTKAYKKAIELYIKGKLDDKAKVKLNKELEKVYNREFTNGFYFDVPNYKDIHTTGKSESLERRIYLGRVDNFYKKVKAISVVLQHEINKEDIIEIEGKDNYIRDKALSIHFNYKDVVKADKGRDVGIQIDGIAKPGAKVYLIKRKEDLKKE